MPQPTTARVAQSAPADLQRERRVSVRFDSAAKGCCQTLSVHRESSWQATVRNISCQGIGLLLERRFEPGALLTIELRDSSAGGQRFLLAKVVHAAPEPEGSWLVGCTLLNPLSEDEIHTLL